MASNVAIRLGLEGSAEIKRGLDEVAKTGQAAFDGMTTAADRAGSAADRTMERWKRMAQAARDAQAADQAQAGINRTLGVVDAPSVTASRDRLRDLEAAFAPIPRRAADIVLANDNITRSIGLQRHEWQNLTRQAGDAITMLAMGSSPLQVILSQGDQVRDVLQNSQGGVKGALKEIGSTLLGLVTPGRLAFGGIIAGATAAVVATSSYLAQQKELEQRLAGMGRASGMTVRDVNRIAESRAGAAGVSVGDARDALATFGATGRIGQQLGGDLLPVGARLSRMLGVDLTEANELLAKAFADPVKGAETLNDRLGNLNDSTRRTIELQIASGDRLGAQKTLMDSVSAATAGATEKLGLWTEAWLKAKGILDSVGKAGASVVAPSLEEQIKAAQRRIDELTIRRNDPSRPGNRGGFGIPLDIPQGEDSSVPALRERLKQLEEELSWRTINENAGIDVVTSGSRSLDVGARVNPYLAEEDAIKKLRGERDALAQDMKNPPQDIAPERIGKAWEVADGAVRTYLDSEEKRQKANELAIRSIYARTDAERAAIAVEQTRLDLAGKKVDIDRKQAELDVEREKMASSVRGAEDRLRASNDNLALAGLLPYQRARAEIEARYRRLDEENAGNEGALRKNATSRANDLRALDIDQIQGPLRAATMSINEQVGAIRVLRESMFATDEQAATFAARQELVNAAIRAGVPVTQAYGGHLEDLAKKMGQVAASNAEFQRARGNIVGGMDEIRSSFSGMLSGVTNDLVSGNGKNVGQTLLRSLSRFSDQMMERLVFKPLTEGIFGRMGQPGGGWLGSLIGGSGIFGTMPNAASPLSMPAITAPMATVNATSVVVNGPGFGIGGAGLGINPATGQPLQGAGSGILGFGLGGGQSSGSAQALGSGLGMFGLGPNGVSTGGDIMGRFLNTARSGGLTNPYALATLAAYGKHESGWSARNMTGSWSDPSESGEAGTSGGLLSWRNGRLASMRAFTAGDGDAASAQARFFLQENPGLTRALQGSGSLEEANRLMAKSWQFKGWNGGAEFTSRLGTSRGYLNSMGTGPRADAGTVDFDAASKSFAESTKTASQSLAGLGEEAAKIPEGAGAATNSLASLVSSLFNFKPEGGGFNLASFFSSAGASVTSSALGNIMTSRGPMRLNMYAGGGIATSPQLSVFGEGRLPEAYVPLPDGRTIPVTMKEARPRTVPAGVSQSSDLRVIVNEAPGVRTSVRRDGNTLTFDQVQRTMERGLAGRIAKNRGELKDAVRTNEAAGNRG